MFQGAPVERFNVLYHMLDHKIGLYLAGRKSIEHERVVCVWRMAKRYLHIF
jgi:hypothetical protein